ncbi:hypothetical protein C6A85_90935 [Mycobacterium sp. ITM-2017-0098]|nr:hypothetical protein C6A85_90935 [Mycobacterium sp. ITM-2017-0098]
MEPADPRTSSRPFLITAQAFALATVAVIVVLFGTAGTLVQAGQLKEVHGAAAIALHVVTGGLMVALAGLAYGRRRGWWAAAVAGVIFVFSFVQAALGEGATLRFHVPGSLVIVTGTIWLTVWLFSSARSETATASG